MKKLLRQKENEELARKLKAKRKAEGKDSSSSSSDSSSSDSSDSDSSSSSSEDEDETKVRVLHILTSDNPETLIQDVLLRLKKRRIYKIGF